VINVYQLVVHGRWFSQGTPASSTTKTGHNYIAEILLKVALITTNQFKSNYIIPAITSKTTRQFDKAELYFSLTHPLLVVYVDIYITIQMKYDLCVMPLRRSFHTLDINWSENISL
jgi:hypothetical protein